MVDTLSDNTSSSCSRYKPSIINTLESAGQTSSNLFINNTHFDCLTTTTTNTNIMEVDYQQQQSILRRRKVSNPINITNGMSLSQIQNRTREPENMFCLNSRNPSVIYSEGEDENDYTLLSEQSTYLAENKMNSFTSNIGMRKVSVVSSTRAYAPLANLNKKKKSSSGISSSSDDSTFAIQESYNNNRRISNESEEFSSIHSSPRFHKKFSQDDGKKKIDLGYYSPRRRTNTSMENFHSAVTKKLSCKEKKESLIGMFEQISTAGFQESRTNCIYEFRKNKRRSAVTRQQNEPLINNAIHKKRNSVPNTFVSNTPPGRSDLDDDSLQIQLNDNNIDDDGEDYDDENRIRSHTITPIERTHSNEHYIINNNKDICGDNVSLETMPPPRRKLSSNHLEPRRRISSTTTTLEVWDQKHKITIPRNQPQRSKSVVTNPMDAQYKTTPIRRFSHTPYLSHKTNNITNEPMRRFSSALPYSPDHHHNYFSGDHQQKFSFEDPQNKFDTKDEVDERYNDSNENNSNIPFVSNISKSNNIFVAQIENERAKISTNSPNSSKILNDIIEPSCNFFNCTPSSGEPKCGFAHCLVPAAVFNDVLSHVWMTIYLH